MRKSYNPCVKHKCVYCCCNNGGKTLSAAEIKRLYESNPNTNNFNNIDYNTLLHFSYEPEIERLVADRVIKNPLEIDMGDVHAMISGGENFYFNNTISDIAYFPVWGGFRDQSVPANQGPSGMIPSSSRVYSNEIRDIDLWGLPLPSGIVPMEFEFVPTQNVAGFNSSFIVMQEVLSTDYIWARFYRNKGGEWIKVFEDSETGTSYLPGDTVNISSKIPMEMYKDENSLFRVTLSPTQYGVGEILNVREADTSLISSIVLPIVDPMPYINVEYRSFENVRLENVTSHLYSSSMNFSIDDTGTTILFIDEPTGNVVNTYPVNTVIAYEFDSKIRIARMSSEIVYIQGLNLDETYIDGTLVTQVLATAINELNALFTNSGSTGVAPVITSSDTITIVFGDSLNYELVATNGVAYSYSGLPTGVAPRAGNPKILIGGSTLAIGVYNFTAIVTNYYGEDTQAMTLNVVAPGTYVNSYSMRFNIHMKLSGVATTSNPFYRLNEASGTPWTVCGWIKGTNCNTSQTMMSFGGTSIYNGEIAFRYRGDCLFNRNMVMVYGTEGGAVSMQTNFNTLSGGWNHFMVTYDGGTTTGTVAFTRFNFFINGVSVSTSNTLFGGGFSGEIPAEAFDMGNDVSTTDRFLRLANLDEMAIWNSDQSANVAAIYNGGVTHNLALLPSPPTSYWRMGDFAVYPTVPDVTGSIPMTMLNMSASNIVNDVP